MTDEDGRENQTRSNGRWEERRKRRRRSQTLYTREITCFVNSAAVTNGYSGGIEWRNGRSTSARTSSPSGMHCSSLYQRRHGCWNLRISRLRQASPVHEATHAARLLWSTCRASTRRELVDGLRHADCITANARVTPDSLEIGSLVDKQKVRHWTAERIWSPRSLSLQWDCVFDLFTGLTVDQKLL